MTANSETVWRVSAVIPTIGRPELYDAVASALAQSAHLHEVVVAADTADELPLPEDPRVVVLRTGPRAGGNVARMAGIRAATGNVIALLDDDDVWRPEKLAEQLAAVSASSTEWLATTSVQEPSGRIWPRRLYQRGERLHRYLFHKTALKGGQGAMHTSTLLFPRDLALEHPFDEKLRFHQDTDWLLRLDREVPGLPILQVVKPLTEIREGDGSVSRGIPPAKSLDWAKRTLVHHDKRTRGDFLITVSYFQAWRHRDLKTAGTILWTAFTWGRPGIKTLPSIVFLPLKVLAARGAT